MSRCFIASSTPPLIKLLKPAAVWSASIARSHQRLFMWKIKWQAFITMQPSAASRALEGEVCISNWQEWKGKLFNNDQYATCLIQLYISGTFTTYWIKLRLSQQTHHRVHMQIVLNVHSMFSNTLLVIALTSLGVFVIFPVSVLCRTERRNRFTHSHVDNVHHPAPDCSR